MRPALVLIALPALAACGHAESSPGIPGSGTGPARSYAVADFTGVELTGSDDVEVSTGTGFSVRAEGEPSALDKLRIVREGQTLKVGRESGWSLGIGRGAKIFVTMPRISDARVTGSGNLRIDHVDGDRFSGEATGSGDLTVHALAVNAATLSVTGSGDMALTGKANSLDLSVTGSGDIDARHVEAAGAKVNVTGSGNVRAEVKGSASVTVMGSGGVDLGGGARCSIQKMGSGSVRCGG